MKNHVFWDPTGPSWEQKWTKNRSKNKVQNTMHLSIDFWAILVDFGSQVGAKLEASRPSKSMKNQSKKGWAFADRSGDVPGASRARIINFSLVLGGLGWGESTDGWWRGGICPTPKASFFKKTPSTTGTGTGTGIGTHKHKGKGTGKHKHKGKGKHVWASMFDHPLTPSRRARWRIYFSGRSRRVSAVRW